MSRRLPPRSRRSPASESISRRSPTSWRPTASRSSSTPSTTCCTISNPKRPSWPPDNRPGASMSTFQDFEPPVFTALTSAIRALAMDAVQKAKSGHPGMPMGMAEIAEVLWNHHLRHNPANPHWPDRDRFVLSNGHGSVLLYALLHLTGYDLPIDELKRFRQLHSKTPGHPEFGLT